MVGVVSTLARTTMCSCGKIGYRRKRQAKLAADNVARTARPPARKDRGLKGSNLVPYECPDTGLWHLTSQREIPHFLLQRPKPHRLT